MRDFTIEQAARKLDKPVRWISACFDSGRLHGWRDPKTFTRYVSETQLTQFVETMTNDPRCSMIRDENSADYNGVAFVRETHGIHLSGIEPR